MSHKYSEGKHMTYLRYGHIPLEMRHPDKWPIEVYYINIIIEGERNTLRNDKALWGRFLKHCFRNDAYNWAEKVST